MSSIAVNRIETTAGAPLLAVANGQASGVFAPVGMRNRIINGDMRIDQRNAGASVTITNTAAVTYTLDRWATYGAVASKFSVQQNAGAVTPPVGFTNYLGVTSLSAYSVGSAEQFTVNQAIEGFNTADLGWGSANAQAVTLSFWVRSSLTGTFGGSLRNQAENRSYPFSYTVSAANTWEQKTLTVPGDTTGTWIGATNNTGIRLFFGIGVGSTLSGTAGAWAGSNFVSATGATSVVGTSGATFYLTGVQLEAGSVATPFERRPYGTELALCQRYFQRLGNASYAAIATGRQQTTTTAQFSVAPRVVMRAAPTVGFSNLIVTERTTFDQGITSIPTVSASQDSIYLTANHSTAGTTNNPVFLAVANGTTGYLELASEL